MHRRAGTHHCQRRSCLRKTGLGARRASIIASARHRSSKSFGSRGGAPRRARLRRRRAPPHLVSTAEGDVLMIMSTGQVETGTIRPVLHGTFIVTGAASGLGLAIAKAIGG